MSPAARVWNVPAVLRWNDGSAFHRLVLFADEMLSDVWNSVSLFFLLRSTWRTSSSPRCTQTMEANAAWKTPAALISIVHTTRRRSKSASTISRNRRGRWRRTDAAAPTSVRFVNQRGCAAAEQQHREAGWPDFVRFRVNSLINVKKNVLAFSATKGGAIEQSHDSDVTGRHVMALLLQQI